MKSLLLLASMTVAVLEAGWVALSPTPSETPNDTPMLNGPVRTFAQVPGTDLLWVGGNFTQVKTRNGTVIDDVLPTWPSLIRSIPEAPGTVNMRPEARCWQRHLST